ncbi:tRNA (adenosine(37)-N6)-threonylcarbamoyltransferase complex transferase subunit TsaD [Lutimonas vermicola]|uniref:tRNA N6-adenosine threonylcarbamoyltransferase n=1 Tax=Lutimonas vermicola TaxID=414288 RepID=A0ABU9KVV6_9FLAO
MKKKTIHILSIESSCDDTGAAVLENNKVLSNVIAGQKIHEAYGGVVPELASRAHQQNIVPVVDQALKTAGIEKEQLQAIAFTKGPGLMGSLLVGTSFAKSLSIALNIPLIPVNHMQAHVLAHFIAEETQSPPPFPFLCMTISGGHTQILKVSAYDTFEILGETIDDAVGEAFDKTAKLLGLPYPGGPLIDKYAKKGKPEAFSFSEPKTPRPLDFSFSGFKTSILYFLQKEQKKDPSFIENNLNDICASVQRSIVTILMNKLKKAAEISGIRHIAIAGGVSANSEIRSTLKSMESQLGWTTYIPKFEYTTDNAAMIGIVGYLKYLDKDFGAENTVATSRLDINS